MYLCINIRGNTALKSGLRSFHQDSSSAISHQGCAGPPPFVRGMHDVEKESRTIGSEFGRSLSMRIGGANGEVRDSMDVVDGRGT